MNPETLVNAVSRCFLTVPAQLPPVRYNGKEYELDVYYRACRFTQTHADLAVLINKYCGFIEKTEHAIAKKRKEQEA